MKIVNGKWRNEEWGTGNTLENALGNASRNIRANTSGNASGNTSGNALGNVSGNIFWNALENASSRFIDHELLLIIKNYHTPPRLH